MPRFILLVFVCAMPLMLASCADTEWPQFLSGEPARAELDAYKGPITMPPADTSGKPYRNLADVPKRPKLTMTPKQEKTLVDTMAEDNAKGQALVESYQEKAGGK